MQVAIGLDKNRNGIFDDGYYQVIEDPVDTNCGTFPNISGLTVSYSSAATGVTNYHTNCAGGTDNAGFVGTLFTNHVLRLWCVEMKIVKIRVKFFCILSTTSAYNYLVCNHWEIFFLTNEDP